MHNSGLLPHMYSHNNRKGVAVFQWLHRLRYERLLLNDVFSYLSFTVYLVTRGVNPREHAIKQELVCIFSSRLSKRCCVIHSSISCERDRSVFSRSASGRTWTKWRRSRTGRRRPVWIRARPGASWGTRSTTPTRGIPGRRRRAQRVAPRRQSVRSRSEADNCCFLLLIFY